MTPPPPLRTFPDALVNVNDSGGVGGDAVSPLLFDPLDQGHDDDDDCVLAFIT